MGTVQLAFAGDCAGDRTIAHDQKWRHRKSRDCSPYFFPVLVPVLFFPVLFSVIFVSLFFSYFFPRIIFPYSVFVLFSRIFFNSTFFPYYFPVLFQKSRRLKSNVLKYQLVVFLVHVLYHSSYSLRKSNWNVTSRASPRRVGCALARSEGTKKWIYLT